MTHDATSHLTSHQTWGCIRGWDLLAYPAPASGQDLSDWDPLAFPDPASGQDLSDWDPLAYPAPASGQDLSDWDPLAFPDPASGQDLSDWDPLAYPDPASGQDLSDCASVGGKGEEQNRCSTEMAGRESGKNRTKKPQGEEDPQKKDL